MGSRLAIQSHNLYEGGVRNVAVNFAPLLDEGETLVGTPTVTNAAGNLSDLVISNEQLNAAEMSINGVAIPASLAVVFRVARGAAAEGEYYLDILVNTSGGQTIPGTVLVNCA